MDLTKLPMLWYVFDGTNIAGTHMFAIIGLLITLVACAASWHQLMDDSGP